VRLINQTGIPINIPYHFNGKEFLLPEGEKKENMYLNHIVLLLMNTISLQSHSDKEMLNQ